MNGQDYKRLLEAGLRCLKNNAEEVNALNVFPIPDGDTGDNMCATMLGGVNAVAGEESLSLKLVSERSARGMLLSARGNSGVILSQIFAGINNGFQKLDDGEEADLFDVVKALEEGVVSSYKAVETPTEGTILTVFREAVEYVKANSDMQSGEAFVATLLKGAEISLENTPNLLAVLKEAGVIDSGGKGVCYVIKGMLLALRGAEDEIGVADAAPETNAAKEIDYSLFNESSEMKFGYCTEFLLQLTNAKTDISKFDVNAFIDGLKGLGGDSIVAFLTGTVVKVHVHSFTPDKMLGFALSFGEFLKVKVENMTLQHNETIAEKTQYVKNEKHKKFGVVTVASGEGLKDTFIGQGADVVIYGGQGNNPSTEDFLKAYDAVNADEIFVLPNNANILLVANASAKEYKGSKIRVIPSKSIGDGYSALSMLDLTLSSGDEIAENMISSMEATVTGLVCRATREANLNSVEIKRDDYIGFCGKEMLCDDPDRIEACFKLLDKLGAKEKYFLVTFYGQDAPESERLAFEERLKKIYPDMEFYGIDGGQQVFDFVFVLA